MNNILKNQRFCYEHFRPNINHNKSIKNNEIMLMESYGVKWQSFAGNGSRSELRARVFPTRPAVTSSHKQFYLFDLFRSLL